MDDAVADADAMAVLACATTGSPQACRRSALIRRARVQIRRDNKRALAAAHCGCEGGRRPTKDDALLDAEDTHARRARRTHASATAARATPASAHEAIAIFDRLGNVERERARASG